MGDPLVAIIFSMHRLLGGRNSIYLIAIYATSSNNWDNCCFKKMMDVYFKTMKLNKDHVYVYELKGHTKHLNIFINKADVFIIMSTPPPNVRCLFVHRWKFRTEVETQKCKFN